VHSKNAPPSVKKKGGRKKGWGKGEGEEKRKEE
jgi:hypothetical protein